MDAPPVYPPPFTRRRPQETESASELSPAAAPPSAAPADPDGASDDVEFVLADARERAQRIIDDSMERARELIERDRPAGSVDPEAVTEMRRSVRDLVVEVRDIQQRLARIETLLREQRAELLQASAVPLPSTATFPAYEPAPAYEAPTPSYEPAPAYEAPTPAYEPAPAYEAPTPAYEPALAYEAPTPAYEPAPAYEAPTPAYEPASEHQPSPTYELSPLSAESESGETEQVAYGVVGEAPEIAAVSYEPMVSSYGSAEQPATEAQPAASAAGALPSPAPAPPRSSFSVVPPQRREWATEPVADAAVSLDVPVPPPSAVPRMRTSPVPMPASDAAWADPEPEDPIDHTLSDAPIATFLPADGSIALRVSPVSGFQGLMRVQDALARLTSVRHASVEAYSQGEARLRIELSEPTDSEEIAAGLARSLNEPARVQAASEADRELLIALR